MYSNNFSNIYGAGANQYGMYPQQGMMQYGQPPKMPAFTNPLGTAKIKKLLEEGNGAPKLKITEDKMNEAICTHRFNGELQTYDIGDGKVKCKICGAEFHPVDNATQEDVKQATENLHDILHTAKIMWPDIPDQVAIDNFQILAVVDQVPAIFDIASNQLKKYSNFNLGNPMGQVNGFGVLNQLMGPGMGMPMQTMPYQAAMPQQPMMPMQPAVDPYGNPIPVAPQMPQMMTPMQQQMTAAAPGVSNGFGYAQPQVQVPVAGESQTAPAQQAATQPAATVTQTLSV